MPKHTFQKVNPQQWDNAIWVDPKAGENGRYGWKSGRKRDIGLKKQEKYYNEKAGDL